MFIQPVHAAIQTSGSTILSTNMAFGDFVLLAISLFVLFAGVFSIVFILWGGLLLILSGGKDEKIKPAINTIRYAVIGIVVTVLTIFLFPLLGGLLGLNVDQYARPERIFAKIEQIGDKIFGNTGGSIFTPSNSSNSLDEFPSDFSDL
ncbi:hypothetical protein MK079_05455 [Candidatus Gracilibacteria bacterium]|nr:hypothetical protein [Candidatus Gracilibacteria bacterium]